MDTTQPTSNPASEQDSSSGWDAAAAQPAGAPSSTPTAAPESTSVTTPAPTAPDATATPSGDDGSKIASQPAPEYAAPAKPVILTPVRPGLMGVVDRILNMFAGTDKPEIAHDQQGNAYVKNTSLSRGEQWQRIGGEALVGAAKGLAAGRGRGNEGAAAAAGVDAGEQMGKQQQDQRQQMTAQARQETLDNANNQMLRMKMAEQAMTMAALKTKATEENIKFADEQTDRLTKPVSQGGGGGTVLGTMSRPDELRNILKVNPDVMQDMIEKHQIEIMPHYNPDGSPGGFKVIKMPDGYRTNLLPAGTVFHTFDETTGKYLEHKTSAPTTQGEIDDYEHAAGASALEFSNKKAIQAHTVADTNKANADAAATAAKLPGEIAKNAAEANQANAAAVKDRAQAKQLNEATDSQTIQNNAQQLVEGSMDPSNLSKRGKTYDATLAAANTYSMQKFGLPFNVAEASADYKFASTTSTKNTLNYLNSLTGRDNSGGNLGLLVQMSDKLPRTQFPPLNQVDQWAKLAAGNPDVAAYRAALVEVDDQIAKILQGGSGGGTSDAKMKQAAEILNKNFSAEQVKAVATNTLRPLLANRKADMIGTNRYLQQWYGHTPAQPSVAPPPGAPAGASQVWHDQSGKVLGYTVNGKYQAAAPPQ